MKNKSLLVSYLSLFASVGTIFCCALPTFLVFLGFGASFAGLIGVFPQITWFSEYKSLVFLVSGGLILVSAFMLYLNQNTLCPLDPNEARACATGRKISTIMVFVAAALWVIGFFFSYLAVKIFV